ncbi:MAG: DUF721 domain-containing protein [Parachlamydiaceae bacterium]
MIKKGPRTPYRYDGTQVTSHQVKDLLTGVLSKLNSSCQERPEMVLEAWPAIIGSKLAGMTQATSFFEGVLTVKVRNSTLHSLLSCHDKSKILTALRQRFPKTRIQNIVFRIG